MQLYSKGERGEKGCLENSQLPICLILGSLLVCGLQRHWRWGLTPGSCPEQVYLWQTACVFLMPRNWVNECLGLGLLGCSCLSNSIHTSNVLPMALNQPYETPLHPTFQPWGHGCSLQVALAFPRNPPSQCWPHRHPRCPAAVLLS